MSEWVRVNGVSGSSDPLCHYGSIDGASMPYLLVHGNRAIGRIRWECDARLLAQAWAMRDMLVEIASLTPDSRINVERMQRINALLRAGEPSSEPVQP